MAHLLPQEYLTNGGPGRPPGAKNLAASGFSHRAFVDALRRNDMQPVDEMCALYRDEGTPARTKFEILKELMSYLYPKRRSVEVKGEVEHRNLNVTWNVDGPSTTASIVDEPSDPA